MSFSGLCRLRFYYGLSCRVVDIAGTSGNIVLRLASIISEQKNHILFFNNWLTSTPLLKYSYVAWELYGNTEFQGNNLPLIK